jgi:hypothetical protein
MSLAGSALRRLRNPPRIFGIYVEIYSAPLKLSSLKFGRMPAPSATSL